MGYNPLVNGVFLGVITHLLTIDPHFLSGTSKYNGPTTRNLPPRQPVHLYTLLRAGKQGSFVAEGIHETWKLYPVWGLKTREKPMVLKP